MKRHSSTKAPREQGVALVTTVIVVAVLAVVAVAFMQSTTVDRLSSRSVANHYRAKLAAEAGAAVAQFMVADLVTRYPDSATVWQNIGGGSPADTNNEATVLYMRARADNTNRGASPAAFGTSVVFLAQPLVSRGTNETAGQPSTAVSTNPLALSNVSSSRMAFNNSSTGLVNINATNSSQPLPFVGRRPATNTNQSQTLLPVTAAEWIYLTNAKGETNARYAFWVEDESFKANINVLTNGVRGSGLGLSPREGRLEGAWTSYSNALLGASGAASAISGRPSNGFPTALTAAFAAAISSDTNSAPEELRFLTTVHSAGLDLSRGGFKRFNINSITNGISGPTDTNNIRTNLNRFIAAITNSNSSPGFGQRFYRLGSGASAVNAANAVSAPHANIYLQKIAANALDYLDADNQPTLIANDASNSIIAGRPAFAIEPQGGGNQGPNPVAAIGQEAVPRLQEYAIHARLLQMNPIGYMTNNPPAAIEADFEFTIDHYFEFWNPTTRDITAQELGNPFIKVHGQPQMGVNVDPLIPEGRDFELPIPTNTVFPAGGIVVLTTAPEEELNDALLKGGRDNVVSVVNLEELPDHRTFKGVTPDTTNNPTTFGNFDRLFHVTMVARTTGSTDYESAVLLANDSGHLESFVGLPLAASGGINPLSLRVTNAAMLGLTDQYFVTGGSLRGNSGRGPRSVEGDPRALNEQLEFNLYVSPSSDDQTRFFWNNLANGNVPSPASTLGLPNSNFVFPTNWVDFSSIAGGSANAPLIVRNGLLHSIAELGHLTDPARVPGTSGSLSNVVYSRGGGRTLRIGQSEHPRWYDGNQANASRTWTSWRLADIFTTTAASNSTTSANTDGSLTNAQGVARGRTNANGVVLSIPGLVNPNGVLRDRGAAFRAALNGLTYLPSPDGVPGLAGLALNDTRLNSVITNMSNYLLTNAATAGLPPGALNAFWERGEISQLPIFNSGNIPTSMSNKFDRGREELVRRSIEMITTRGSVFTVYAVGQALQVTSVATNVIGSARLKQTFQIEPQFDGGTNAFNDAFDPNDALQSSERFSAPTNYTISVLATSYD